MKVAAQISVAEAAELIKTGDTLVVGGFGMTGHPVHLLHAIAATDVRELTYIGVRDLYQHPGVAATLRLDHIKAHYYGSHESINPTRIVPVGPEVDYSAPHDRARLS